MLGRIKLSPLQCPGLALCLSYGLSIWYASLGLYTQIDEARFEGSP